MGGMGSFLKVEGWSVDLDNWECYFEQDFLENPKGFLGILWMLLRLCLFSS